MEFFVCPCTEIGNVILDGIDQGPNKDDAGNLLTKQCNAGIHTITLQSPNGKKCSPPQAKIEIKDTNPISPLEVPFQCIDPSISEKKGVDISAGEAGGDRDAITVRLQSDRWKETREIQVTRALARLLHQAQLFNRHDTNEKYDLSFSALLLTFLESDDSDTNWFKLFAKEVGASFDDIFAQKRINRKILKTIANSEVSLPSQTALTLTSSASHLIDVAVLFTSQVATVPSIPDTRHLMAALIYQPDPEDSDLHQQQLDRWMLNRRDWGNQFLREMFVRHPAEQEGWKRIHNSVFGEDGADPFNGSQPDPAPLHIDIAAQEDHLGRKGFVEAMAVRMNRLWDAYHRKEVKGSFIVHLHGPWGSGKTTMLNLLRAELQQNQQSGKLAATNAEKRWIVVEFNAWQQHRTDPPWWPLLDAVYHQAVAQTKGIYKNPGKAWKIQFVEWMWRFWTVRPDTLLVAIALVLTSIILLYTLPSSWNEGTKETGTLPQIIKIIGTYASSVKGVLGALSAFGAMVLLVRNSLLPSSARAAQAYAQLSRDPLERISLHFHSLVKRIERPVMIFIDDLDRCQSTYVVNLVEKIQTLFNDPRVFYVVTADRHWLTTCFEKEYEPFVDSVREPGRRMGHLFLEKTFDLSVSMPYLSRDTRKHYLNYLVLGDSGAIEEERKSASAAFVGAATETDVFEKLEASKADPVRQQVLREAAVRHLASQDVEMSTEYFLKQFAPLMEPNPRAMKRLLNAYVIARDKTLLGGMEKLLADEKTRKRLVLWTIISLRWPLLGDLLLEQPDKVGLFRGKDSEEMIEPEFQKLAKNKEVLRVLSGEGVAAALDADAIRQICWFEP
jgi:hypothetical protein